MIKKVCIVGNTASGKSFLAERAGQALGLPVFHLDQLYWRADWTHVSRTDFLQGQRGLIGRDQWVIDGCFSEFGLDGRFQAADAVVFIDRPAWSCLRQAVARRGKPQAGIAADTDTKMGWGLALAFLAEIVLFPLLDRPRILRAARRSSARFFVVREWTEEEGLLAALQALA